MAKRFNNIQEATEYLQTLPISTLINIAAEALLVAQGYQAPTKITITEQQFREHFRIRGIAENGEPETRGRKPKEV